MIESQNDKGARESSARWLSIGSFSLSSNVYTPEQPTGQHCYKKQCHGRSSRKCRQGMQTSETINISSCCCNQGGRFKEKKKWQRRCESPRKLGDRLWQDQGVQKNGGCACGYNGLREIGGRRDTWQGFSFCITECGFIFFIFIWSNGLCRNLDSKPWYRSCSRRKQKILSQAWS